jgi:hypothetical protein
MAALFSNQSVLMPARVRILAGMTAAVCWIGLALQFALIVQATQELAESGGLKFPLLAAVAVFLSFLTLQITFLVALVTTRAALSAGAIVVSRLASALVAYMIAGSIIFSAALQPYWHHAGAQLLADVLLHGVTPVLYLAFWLAAPKIPLQWRDAILWVFYPAIYLALLLLAARWTGFYPYPFVDVRALSFWSLVFNGVAIGVTFLSIGFAVVLISRLAQAERLN